MRAAAILGLGSSSTDLRSFQEAAAGEWIVGLPSSAEGIDAVLVFGGDGTVHRHLHALVRLGLPVLIVPAGSGNDIARALGLLRMRDSLAAWREFSAGRERVRSIDLGSITPLDGNASPHYFACVGGAGLDADIARRANGLPRWLKRSGGYALTLPTTLLAFAPFRMKLWLSERDGAEILSQERLEGTLTAESHAGMELRSDQATVLAAFANAPFYGGGMKIAPDAQLDDGLLDVCLVRGMGKFKLMGLFPTVYFGRHLGIREVESFRATRAVIETEYPLDVYADGEYVCKTPAEFGVERAALQVIVRKSD